MSNPPTIPRSPHGGIDPRLRARITTATEAVSEYTADTTVWIRGTGEQPAWQSWSWRLHSQLRALLELLQPKPQGKESGR